VGQPKPSAKGELGKACPGSSTGGEQRKSGMLKKRPSVEKGTDLMKGDAAWDGGRAKNIILCPKGGFLKGQIAKKDLRRGKKGEWRGGGGPLRVAEGFRKALSGGGWDIFFRLKIFLNWEDTSSRGKKKKKITCLGGGIGSRMENQIRGPPKKTLKGTRVERVTIGGQKKGSWPREGFGPKNRPCRRVGTETGRPRQKKKRASQEAPGQTERSPI